MIGAKPTVSLGPYFIPQAHHSPDSGIEAKGLRRLDIAMEMATAEESRSIELFRSSRDYNLTSQHRQRVPYQWSSLADIVFHEDQLPLTMECEEQLHIKTHMGDFIPLELVLARLYERHLVSRPLLQVLRELGEKADSKTAAEEDREGLLIPSVEAEGFRLQSAYQIGDEPCHPKPSTTLAFARIGWQHSSKSTALHVGTHRFRLCQTSGKLDQGNWMCPRFLCFSRLLTHELQQLAPGGNPVNLLTPDGRQALRKSEPIFRLQSV